MERRGGGKQMVGGGLRVDRKQEGRGWIENRREEGG